MMLNNATSKDVTYLVLNYKNRQFSFDRLMFKYKFIIFQSVQNKFADCMRFKS